MDNPKYLIPIFPILFIIIFNSNISNLILNIIITINIFNLINLDNKFKMKKILFNYKYIIIIIIIIIII